MSNISLDNIFTVSSVSKIYKTDVRFNICKYRERIVYKVSSNEDNINLSYDINKEINSGNSLNIVDKGSSFLFNRHPKRKNQILFTGKTYSLQTNKFLVTDVFLKNKNGQSIPLYYKHVLSNFDPSNVNQKLSNIEIVNSDFELLPLNTTFIDKVAGVIYNNLSNQFDQDSGIYNIYYVKYSLVNIMTNAVNNYIEILNNTTTYRQAEFDDIPISGIIPDTLKVYTIDLASSNLYELTLPTTKLYALKEESDSVISLLKPTLTDIKNPWFVSVSNGSFYATLLNNAGVGNIFFYSIAEYGSQLFQPYAPFKFKDKEISARINNSLFQLYKKNITTADSLYVYIIIYGVDNNIKHIISTDPLLIGTEVDGVTITNNIRSIDKLNGIVDTDLDIKETDKIESSYYYEEKEYEIFDIDFNPVSNNDIISKRIVFYIVPTINNRNRTLYYLIVDNNGLIVSTSQTDDPNLTADISTNAFYYDKTSVDSSHLNFIDKYTVQVSAIFTFSNPTNPHYLILGDVSVSSKINADESVLFDIRQHGGGLKKTEGLLESLLPSYPELQWTTDIGHIDGIPYPGTNSFICEVPISIQQENGGTFSDTSIRDIIERHMVFGNYPIVRGYSTEILPILEAITTTGPVATILASWRSFGSGRQYNVYYSTFKDHSFVKANLTPITDNSSGNTYTINAGLLVNKVYWVYVVETNGVIDLAPSIINPTNNLTIKNFNKVSVKTYSLPV